MVETIFDVANLIGGIWFWYIFLIVIIGVWANSKNRNGFAWAVAALLLSPLIVGIILLFTGKQEKKEAADKDDALTCTDCGTPVGESDKFCPECGVEFEDDSVSCPKCKKLNASASKYCSKCGESLVDEPEEEFVCRYCDKKCKSDASLKKHYEVCSAKKKQAEKDKAVAFWIVGSIVFLMFALIFLFVNKINLIPLVIIAFILTPFFDKSLKAVGKKYSRVSKFKFNWWKKALVISGIIIVFVIINALVPECPASCDDGNACTNDLCGKDTSYQCFNPVKLNCDGNGICEAGEYGKSLDCPDCNDGDRCTADTYDPASKQCIHTEMKGCVGS